MDRELYLIILPVSFLFNVGAYFFIRSLIWSIVWCDRGGKSNKLSRLKRGRTVAEKISMAYLCEYITVHSKEFRFWCRVRRIFAITSFAVCLIGILLGVFYSSAVGFANVFGIGYLALSIVFANVFMWQFDLNRNSKYDRKRIAGKKR